MNQIHSRKKIVSTITIAMSQSLQSLDWKYWASSPAVQIFFIEFIYTHASLMRKVYYSLALIYF